VTNVPSERSTFLPLLSTQHVGRTDYSWFLGFDENPGTNIAILQSKPRRFFQYSRTSRPIELWAYLYHNNVRSTWYSPLGIIRDRWKRRNDSLYSWMRCTRWRLVRILSRRSFSPFKVRTPFIVMNMICNTIFIKPRYTNNISRLIKQHKTNKQASQVVTNYVLSKRPTFLLLLPYHICWSKRPWRTRSRKATACRGRRPPSRRSGT